MQAGMGLRARNKIHARLFNYLIRLTSRIWASSKIYFLVPLLLLAAGLAQAQEWTLAGGWSIDEQRGHQIISVQGVGSASAAGLSETVTPAADLIQFGVAIADGQLDVVFRKSDQGAYRIALDSSGTPNLSLTKLDENDLDTVQLAKAEMPAFDIGSWHHVEIRHHINSDDGKKEKLHLSVKIDGLLSLSTVDDETPLPRGKMRFESKASTNLLIDLADDAIDIMAQKLRRTLPSPGVPEDGIYIAKNRNSFANTYTSMGRNKVFVEKLQSETVTTVINELGLNDQGYALPEMIGAVPLLIQPLPLPSTIPSEGVVIQPSESLFPNPPRRPVIFSVNPWKSDGLNTSSDTIFDIYGTDLGDDMAVVFLGGYPTEEQTLRHTFPIQSLIGEVALKAPGNWDGLEEIQRIAVDLRELSPSGNPQDIPFESENKIWILPDYSTDTFSNEARIFLNSRWPSVPMMVAYAKGFHIIDDGEGGIPEQLWAFAGSTERPSTDSGTNECLTGSTTTTHGGVLYGVRQTHVGFPYRESAPWMDGDRVKTGIPIFAERTKCMSKYLRILIAGHETDQSEWGDIIKKIAEGLGKAMGKIKSKSDLQTSLTGAAGGITESMSGLIDPADTRLGLFSGLYEEAHPDWGRYGEFDESAFESMGNPGGRNTEVDVDIMEIDAPYIESIDVRVKSVRWSGNCCEDAFFTNDLFVVARASTGFNASGTLQGSTASLVPAGLRTRVFEDVRRDDLLQLSGNDGLVLSATFTRPVPAPFLYLEFAVWDEDETYGNSSDNFGAPYTKLYFLAYPPMDPHLINVTKNDKITLHGVGFDQSVEIEFEFTIQKATSLPLP